MQRTVASFALATLSLLVSYAIVATWPSEPVIAEGALPLTSTQAGARARQLMLSLMRSYEAPTCRFHL